MSTRTTVMQNHDDSTYENRLQQEYEQAVENGFAGTYEEYLVLRDYT